MLEGEIRMMSPTVNHVWDSRNGWMKPKRRIEVLPYLYLEGYKLFWDIPKPSFPWDKLDEYNHLFTNFIGEGVMPRWSGNEEYNHYCKYDFSWEIQHILNKILVVLPIIPIVGFILGLVI